MGGGGGGRVVVLRAVTFWSLYHAICGAEPSTIAK
jgi:hypothetical protein